MAVWRTGHINSIWRRWRGPPQDHWEWRKQYRVDCIQSRKRGTSRCKVVEDEGRSPQTRSDAEFTRSVLPTLIDIGQEIKKNINKK